MTLTLSLFRTYLQTKFETVEIEIVQSNLMPAYLRIIRKDKLYFTEAQMRILDSYTTSGSIRGRSAYFIFQDENTLSSGIVITGSSTRNLPIPTV